MKRLDELTKDECQEFLDEIFEDEKVKYNKMIFDSTEGDIDCCGIEYQYENESKSIISFSNPELIKCLYKHDVDLTIPLKQLQVDFIDMDETNSILFEYVMGVNRILTNTPKSMELTTLVEGLLYEKLDQEVINDIEAERTREIRKLQKDLISKL